MKIKWYGHSCFKIESKDGIRIITDPFDEKVGYNVPNLEADIVAISHSHYDHNNLSAVNDGYKLTNEPYEYKFNGIWVKGIQTFHDEVNGAKRGENIIFIFNIDMYKVAHLGDLGHIPDSNICNQLRDIDILLIPVGGVYTIDSAQAHKLVDIIHPKIVIPMHYKTKVLSFDLDLVENFTKYFNDIEYLKSNELVIDKDIDDKTRIIVLEY